MSAHLYREDMHRLIMKVLAAQSKKVAVKKQFEGLKTLLSGELGVEPAPETRRLYKELMHETSSPVER